MSSTDEVDDDGCVDDVKVKVGICAMNKKVSSGIMQYWVLISMILKTSRPSDPVDFEIFTGEQF